MRKADHEISAQIQLILVYLICGSYVYGPLHQADLPEWNTPGLNFPLDWESAEEIAQDIQEGSGMTEDIYTTQLKDIIYDRIMQSDRPHYLIMMAISNWTTQLDDFFFMLDHKQHWRIPDKDEAHPLLEEQIAQREYWVAIQRQFSIERTEK